MARGRRRWHKTVRVGLIVGIGVGIFFAFPKLRARVLAYARSLDGQAVSRAADKLWELTGTDSYLVDNDTVRRKVLTELSRVAHGLAFTGLKVDAAGGRVALYGEVKNNRQREVAETVAASLHEVDTVINRLHVADGMGSK